MVWRHMQWPIQGREESNCSRDAAGFSLTEMLVTTLILALVSTLLVTGVSVAIDTYQKMVKTANAQVALSTTITVLRSELGRSQDVRVDGANNVVYYLAGEGYWACIRNAEDAESQAYGLVKCYLAGAPAERNHSLDAVKGLSVLKDSAGNTMAYPLVSDSAITEPLRVKYSGVESGSGKVGFKNLVVTDGTNTLASVGDEDAPFYISTRFVSSLESGE